MGTYYRGRLVTLTPIAPPHPFSPAFLSSIQPIIEAPLTAGGTPYIVGGAVRDSVMGIEPTDADIEVHGLPIPALRSALEAVAPVQLVGEAFGVFKVHLPGGTIDISVPRRDSKIGKGHRGFAASFDPVGLHEALARRDFTMNAMAYDPVTGCLHDPYGGSRDIRNRILRHVSPAFAEDPLRVLRAMQFASRFAMSLAGETALLCDALLDQAPTLPTERVWVEWRKWALAGHPSFGLGTLLSSHWIDLYPELAVTLRCPQDPKHHPEGAVWTHTCCVCLTAAAIAERDGLDDTERTVLVFAALCHDLGKPSTTIEENGRITSPGHARVGARAAARFLQSIGCPASIATQVFPLVREHMAHIGMPLRPRPVHRLALRLEPSTIRQWARLIEADFAGRPPLPPKTPAARIVEYAETLQVTDGKPEPILMGRHLIAQGMTPGTEFTPILRAAYEAQIAGEFASIDGALSWLASHTSI